MSAKIYEFARRGHEIYESQVRSQVEEGNYGKIVASDIEDCVPTCFLLRNVWDELAS